MSAKNLSNTQSFLSRKWVLPAFGILAASIFVVVHLSNGEWDETPNLAGADGDNRDVFTGRDEGGGVLDEDEGSTFSYIPTKAPSEDLTLVPMPTSTTVVHPVPEIPDLEPSSGGDDGGGDGSNSTDDGGDGIITVPTTTTNGAPSVPATLDPAAPPSATLAPAPSFPATLDPAAPPSATLAPVIAPSAPSLPATLDPAAPPSATLSPTRDPASPPIDRPLEVATNVPSLSPSINPASPNAGSPVVVIIPFPDGNQPSSVPSINPASPNAGSPVVVIIPFPEGNRPTSAPSINPASPNAGSPVVVVIPFPEGDTPTSAPASPSTDSPVPGNTPTTAEPTEAPAIVTTPVSGPPTTPITSVPVPAAPVVVPPPPVPRPPVVVPQPIPVAPVAQQPPSPLPPRQPVPVVVPSPVQPSPGIPSVPGVPGQPGIPGGAGGGGNGGNGGTPGTGGSGGVPGQPGIPGGAGGGGNGGNGGGGGGGGNGGGGNSGGGGGGGSSGGGGGSSGGGGGSSGGGGGGGGGTGGGGSGNNGGWYPVPGGGGQGGGDNGQPPPWWWYPGYPPWAFPGNTGPPAFVPTSVPAPTPAPVPFHNTKFLEGCNPLQCILNEETDFHSMSAEDESIYEIFYTNPIKCCKVIVEIGAGDGDRYSTSRYFEEALNWRSLLIEANPDMYQQLVSNRPNSTTENAAFCEADHVLFDQGQFHAVGGSIEVTSESHTPPMVGSSTAREIPCISMRDIFPKYGITHVDVMVIRVQGDALAFIRSMDWTVRVDIWVVLMHGPSRAERDELVRTVLSNNEYVQAEWDIKRWCSENGQCLNNEVFLRKGFNPLPSEVQRSLASRHGPKKK